MVKKLVTLNFTIWSHWLGLSKLARQLSSRCRILFRAGRRELWQFGLLVRQGVPYRESGVSSHRGVVGVVARFQEQDVADGEEVEDDVDLQ